MCNIELETAQAVVESTSYTVSVHDVVGIILFLAVLVLTVLTTTVEGFLMAINKKTDSWENNPKVKMAKLISKAVIGITVIFYIVYLLATWSAWNWKIPLCIFILFPLMGALISCAIFLLGIFVYKFIYEPLTVIISYFQKK